MNSILKRPVNKLYPTECTYHDTNQTDKGREQKLRPRSSCNRWGKEKIWLLTTWTLREREEESLNIANVNVLVRFNKTWEIFPSATWVISILTTAATSATVERVNSEQHVRKVRFWLPTIRRGDFSAAIIQLRSKWLWCGWKS